MKTKLIRETDVLRHICEYLSQRGYLFWRSNNIPVFGRSMPKYSMKGMADICGVWDGTFFAIEVKRPSLNEREANGRMLRGGKLSITQAEFGARVVLNGGEYLTAFSVDDVEKFFQGLSIKKGVPLKRQAYGQVN